VVKSTQNEKVVYRGVTAKSARAELAEKGKLSPAGLKEGGWLFWIK